MRKAEIESYRRRLLMMKKRLGSVLSELEEEALRGVGGEAGGNLSDLPISLGDLGSANYEEEVSVGLMENEDQLLVEINDALERIEQGTFGRCEECNEEISRKRLEVLPYARYCLRCARKLQDR